MSNNLGNCFVVLKPHTKSDCIIYGRNSYREGEAYEVLYFPAADESSKKICNNIEIDDSSIFAIILSTSSGLWGGESGANEKGVCIGITWSKNDIINFSTDLVRLTLERSSSAEEAIDVLGGLIEKCGPNDDYKNDIAKYSFVVCDTNSLWILNGIGKLWAAEMHLDGCKNIFDNFTITTKIDKHSDVLMTKAQELGLWDGNGDFNFCTISMENRSWDWPNDIKIIDDGSFIELNMFDILRITSCQEQKYATTSHVSILTPNGISCHWFTGTQNPCESVFKPFIFSGNPIISPLTQKSDADSVTLLQKLHSQRNWAVIGDLLCKLEKNCVEEIAAFLLEMKSSETIHEVDELMKDCVEAEVKFYR